MRAVGWGAWTVGVVGLAGAVAAWLLLPSPLREALSLGLAAGGAMAALVLQQGGVPESTLREVAAGSARAARDLAEAVALAGSPVFVPGEAGALRERVFLATSDDHAPLPVLDPETRLYVTQGARRGVALEPPGLALVLAAEAATGASLPGAGLPDIEVFLRGLGARTGLWRGLWVASAQGTIEARFGPGRAMPCSEPDARAACAQGVCPACGAIAVALCRGTGRTLILQAIEEEGGLLRMRLREADA